MLKDYFDLNKPYDCYGSPQQLKDAITDSDELSDILYSPDTLSFVGGDSRDLFKGKTFTNMSFSKTVISGITFRDCAFVDCLFIDTTFDDCEFHQCRFEGCNPFKIKINDTYIDPSAFEGMIDKKLHSNVGIYLFQKLYDNAMKTNQPKFARIAEFNMRKWERYDLDHKYRGRNKLSFGYLGQWTSNVLSYFFMGYGISAKFWTFWATLIIVGSILFNFHFWEQLGIVGNNETVIESDWINVVYYTAGIFGGFADHSPGSPFGKIVFTVEAFLGLGIVWWFLSWIIKRAVR